MSDRNWFLNALVVFSAPLIGLIIFDNSLTVVSTLKPLLGFIYLSNSPNKTPDLAWKRPTKPSEALTPFLIPLLIAFPTATSSAGNDFFINFLAIFKEDCPNWFWAFIAALVITPDPPGTFPKSNSTVCNPLFWVTWPSDGVTPASI